MSGVAPWRPGVVVEPGDGEQREIQLVVASTTVARRVIGPGRAHRHRAIADRVRDRDDAPVGDDEPGRRLQPAGLDGDDDRPGGRRRCGGVRDRRRDDQRDRGPKTNAGRITRPRSPSSKRRSRPAGPPRPAASVSPSGAVPGRRSGRARRRRPVPSSRRRSRPAGAAPRPAAFPLHRRSRPAALTRPPRARRLAERSRRRPRTTVETRRGSIGRTVGLRRPSRRSIRSSARAGPSPGATGGPT